MFNNNNGTSAADIAALSMMDNNRGFYPYPMWGGNGGWGNNFFNGDGIWALIILAFVFGGFGGFGGGFGWGGGNNNQAGFYATQSDLQRGFDTAALSSKIDNLEIEMQHGVKDPGYMISNSFAQAELSRANNQSALLQQMNNLAMIEQQDNCSTQNLITSTGNNLQFQIMNSANQEQANTAQIRYDMATSDCAIKNAITTAVRDITDNANANFRSLHDEMVASQMAALNETIRRQDNQIDRLQLAASQAQQNQYLIDQLRPAAVPSYNVPAPWYSGCCNWNQCCNN